MVVVTVAELLVRVAVVLLANRLPVLALAGM